MMVSMLDIGTPAALRQAEADFGDGFVVTQTSAIARHAYTRRGIFRIRVTVTDTAGQTSTASDLVLVF